MKTYRFYLGAGLFGLMTAELLRACWIVWMIKRVAIPTGGTWAAHFPDLALALIAAGGFLLAGLSALAWERRAFSGRKKFDHFTLRNIALVGYPSGSALAALLDREPVIAMIMADAAWLGRSAKSIYRDAKIREWIELRAEWRARGSAAIVAFVAIDEAVEIYRGVPVKPFKPARRRTADDLNP